MTTTPTGSRFEFVAMASARAKQLLEGCRPRVAGSGKPARIAQREVQTGALWQDPATTNPEPSAES
ncbi:MAG TPA: DNA-directed RNA polymerase subunit omega [Vicinamibacterales bacterium]